MSFYHIYTYRERINLSQSSALPGLLKNFLYNLILIFEMADGVHPNRHAISAGLHPNLMSMQTFNSRLLISYTDQSFSLKLGGVI